MDGNQTFQLLTAFILSLFAAVFLVVYLYDRTQKFAGWMAVAYCSALAAFSMDIVRTVDSFGITVVMNTAFWGTSGAIVAALCARIEQPFPRRFFIGLLCMGYLNNLYFTFVTPDFGTRSAVSNMIGGLIIALALPTLLPHRTRKIDHAIFMVMIGIAVTMFARPFLSFAIFGSEYGEDYANSGYALILHLTSAFMALAGAIIMLLAAGLDMTDRLHRLSRTDHLTGLRNRRGMEAIFDRTETADMLNGSAIITLDIDKFKMLNDKYGHPVGDVILKRIANCLNQLIGEIGDVGRIGGEEFLILLNRNHAEAAIHFAEQIRSAVARIDHPEMATNEKVTASFGIAIVGQGETSSAALRRADIALYAAKDGGRNRVEKAEFSVEQKRSA